MGFTMKRFLLGLCLTICVAVSALSAYTAAHTATVHNQASAVHTKELNALRTRLSELESEPDGFAILRETDGVIGLYDTSGKVLLCTIDTPVISLPEEERGQIMVGLKVKDAFHFLQLFENLSE